MLPVLLKTSRLVEMTTSNPGDSPTPFPLQAPWPTSPNQLFRSPGGDGGGSHPWPWFKELAAAVGGSAGGGDFPWPWSLIASGLANDLIGRTVRLTNEKVTGDIVPGRVTILVDKDMRITDLWVDPDNPTT